MSRRTAAILYWSSTILVALFMAALCVAYFTMPYFVIGMQKLGFPDYFRVILGIAKGLGAVALLIQLPERIKSFVYDGFAIMFVCGAIAHVISGGPLATALGGIIALALLVISCISQSKLNTFKLADNSHGITDRAVA
jgi:hypothetical protein